MNDNRKQKKIQNKMNKIATQQNQLNNENAEDTFVEKLNIPEKNIISNESNTTRHNGSIDTKQPKTVSQNKTFSKSYESTKEEKENAQDNSILHMHGTFADTSIPMPPISSKTPIDSDELVKSVNNNSEQKKKKGLFNFKSSKKNNKKAIIPKTAQESIPYINVYKNGIIETDIGIYSKSYFLNDVNFRIATQEEQENIFLEYGNLLNMFGPNVKAEITIYNRNIDKDKFKAQAFLKMKNDGLDKYRIENNEILESKMENGKNNIIHEKYLTLSVEAENIDDAFQTFAQLDTNVAIYVKKVNGGETHPMSLEERLAILYEIYNPDANVPFGTEVELKQKNKKIKSFDLSWLKKQGITTKDLIAPASISFNTDYFTVGDRYARTLFIDNLPTFLSTDLLPDITDIACNMITSVYFEQIAQDKSIKLLRNQMVNINSNVIDAQKKANKNGYSSDLISPELQKAQDEAQKIMSDFQSRNQNLFLVTMVITILGATKEELDRHTSSIQSTASKFLCGLKKLNYQQEPGFTASLPLANNKLYIQRLLTTESASVFMPFSAQELAENNGMYYGLNAVSHNLIRFNRINSKNANGVILGTPGSGKSFAAKREMINVILGTDDDIYVIDPEREYAPLAALFGGQVVRIAAGSKTYINPLDMDIDYADDDDPITLKSDFIGSICETVIGGRYGLSPIQKSVIDRCVREVYKGYIQHLQKLDENVTCDREATPTLDDFYQVLLAQPEPEAQNIALSLEIYCRGSLDTFSHKTNVNTNSRFIVYDIKDIGSGMKEMGLQVCLNDIWNKIIENKKKGKRTWFYIDEFYLLTQTDSSARFLQQVYKRARKWGGVPTGITQNVEDLLSSKEARGIINNCDFVMMLNQAPLDRAELGSMLNISPAQMSYITNADAGQGLIYTGKFIVPFIDEFPKGNSLYKAMTTKPDEVNLEDFEVKVKE